MVRYSKSPLKRLGDAAFLLASKVEEIWSAQESARSELNTREIFALSSGEADLVYEINFKKFVSRLHPKQKLLFYILLRFIEVEYKSSTQNIVNLWVQDWKSHLERLLRGSKELIQLQGLTEKEFKNWILVMFHRQQFGGSMFFLLEKTTQKENKRASLLRIIEEHISEAVPQIRIKYKSKPRKPQFVRHQRDHGSLGPPYSQILKEERKDVFLQEAYRKMEVRNQRYHHLIKLLLR